MATAVSNGQDTTSGLKKTTYADVVQITPPTEEAIFEDMGHGFVLPKVTFSTRFLLCESRSTTLTDQNSCCPYCCDVKCYYHVFVNQSPYKPEDYNRVIEWTKWALLDFEHDIWNYKV